MNTLENSTKHKPKGKNSVKCKGNENYPEAKHEHDIPSLETPFLKHTLNFSLNKQRMGSSSLGAHKRWKWACGMRGEDVYL
jgi:hypothetical protein